MRSAFLFSYECTSSLKYETRTIPKRNSDLDSSILPAQIEISVRYPRQLHRDEKCDTKPMRGLNGLQHRHRGLQWACVFLMPRCEPG